MVDLGKMLAEAIVDLAPPDCRGRVQKWLGPERIGMDVDLTAAAEAFLAKVREAEKLQRDQPPSKPIGAMGGPILRDGKWNFESKEF